MEFTNFSVKLKKLRAKKKISLEELAAKTGMTKEYLSQIEENKRIAPVSVVLEVAQALAVSSDELLMIKEEKRKQRKAQKQRREGIKKRVDNYSYQILTPTGKTNHLNAFKVTIEPHQKHDIVEAHHPGEEFIYVLSGELELKVGRNSLILKPGESKHFDSSKSHQLKSVSKDTTNLLVIVYSP